MWAPAPAAAREPRACIGGMMDAERLRTSLAETRSARRGAARRASVARWITLPRAASASGVRPRCDIALHRAPGPDGADTRMACCMLLRDGRREARSVSAMTQA